MSALRPIALVAALLLLVTPSVVFGQRAATVSASATKAAAVSTESRSAGLAAELTQLLTEKKLDSIATTDPAGDQYVGALYIPGAQLLVIRAKYPSKDRMSYLLYNKMYKDAYVDLNSASDPTTRVFITDLGANGLQFKREKDQPFDMVDLGGKAMAFDGKWGGKEAPSRDEYAQTYQTSDEQYSLMLQALIEALKKSS